MTKEWDIVPPHLFEYLKFIIQVSHPTGKKTTHYRITDTLSWAITISVGG